MKIDGNHLRDPSYHRIAAGKAPSIPGAISDGDDPFRVGGRMIGALQRVAHVLRDRSGYHQHIGMTRRRNEPETEALDVVVGIVQRVDFKFASIAGSGIDLPYGEAASETPSCGEAHGYCQFGYRGIVRRRRFLGERPTKQAFKKQLAHLVPFLRDRGPNRSS